MNRARSEPTDGGSIFTFLAAVFKRHNVHSVLVGGYALVANKVQRMTFDIDFILTEADMAKIEPDILDAGYSVVSRQEAFVQFGNAPRGLRDLDFLIADKHTVGRLAQEGREITIAGERFTVPSPVHLIAMKLHSIAGNRRREMKDLPDVASLIEANGLDPKSEEIRGLFVKYGLMDIFARIAGGPRTGGTDGQ